LHRVAAIAAVLCALLSFPAAASPPDLPRVKELTALVAEDCGACHGMTRRGGLGPPLTREALAGKSVEALVATILDGRPDTPMPPWRGLLSDADAAWIVRFLKEGGDGS
jgi:cytochrome c55X